MSDSRETWVISLPIEVPGGVPIGRGDFVRELQS